MNFRHRIRRLERISDKEMIVIPQKDGTVRRFPPHEYLQAFKNAVRRMGAGEDAPPRHPMLEAARNSSDPNWREGFFGFADLDFEGVTEPVPDLSEE